MSREPPVPPHPHIYAKAAGVWCGSEADASRRGCAEASGRLLAMSVGAWEPYGGPGRLHVGTRHYDFPLCS